MIKQLRWNPFDCNFTDKGLCQRCFTGKIVNIRTTVCDYLFDVYRSSLSQMLFKIDVLKNFANFTPKHRYWSLFFNIVAG